MTKTSTKVFALVLPLTLVLGACTALDELLEVDAPSQVIADDLQNPAAAQLMVNSVANEVRCAYAYFAAAGALTGNEWRDVSNNTVLNIWDSRTHDTSGYGAQYASADCGSTQPAIYQPQARARWIADFTLDLLAGWDAADVPNKAELQRLVGMYAGYAYLIMGESMCETAFDNGPVVQPSAVFDLAISRFETAASGSDDVANAAKVGMARAQLNVGQASAAAGTVASVPAGFTWELPFSDASNVTRNPLWNISIDDENVSPAEPYRNFQYGGVDDPRVNTFYTGRDHPRTGLEIWNSDKFPGASSPLEMASYAEAQLIIAEAAIPGNLAAAVGIIDDFHDAAGLPDYGAEGEGTPATTGYDADEVLEHLVLHERAAELFLEGQHLYDLTRHSDIIDLFPAVGVDDGFGGQYSNQICFDLPATEFQNNTTIVG